MKLRNFLYLNTKIINDYLSAIEGFVYDEEAQSIATSTEKGIKAGEVLNSFLVKDYIRGKRQKR